MIGIVRALARNRVEGVGVEVDQDPGQECGGEGAGCAGGEVVGPVQGWGEGVVCQLGERGCVGVFDAVDPEEGGGGAVVGHEELAQKCDLGPQI